MVWRRLTALVIGVLAVIVGAAAARAETQPSNPYPYVYLHTFDREISSDENDYWWTQSEAAGGFGPVMHRVATSREGYQTMVEYGYRRLLGRMPDAAGARHYTDRLVVSGDVLGFVIALASSNEARQGKTNQDFVAALYARILDRSPDAGASYWTERLARGARPSAVARAIATSNEADALRMRALFLFVFEREPDATGARYWQARMNDSRNLLRVVADAMASDEYLFRAGGSRPACPRSALVGPALALPASFFVCA